MRRQEMSAHAHHPRPGRGLEMVQHCGRNPAGAEFSTAPLTAQSQNKLSRAFRVSQPGANRRAARAMISTWDARAATRKVIVHIQIRAVSRWALEAPRDGSPVQRVQLKVRKSSAVLRIRRIETDTGWRKAWLEPREPHKPQPKWGQKPDSLGIRLEVG
jgi:hypothetical protein